MPRGQAAMRATKAAMACLALILAGCRPSSEQRAEAQPAYVRRSSPIEAQPAKLPPCPPGLPLIIPPIATARHQVVLSWNPSTSATGPLDKSLGYCLYRSEKPIRAKKLAECRNCELINQNPVIGTGCVDVDVEDGKTYFYAALAIQNGRSPSVFSNQAEAPIQRKPPMTHPASSYPLCREPSVTKEAPGRPEPAHP